MKPKRLGFAVGTWQIPLSPYMKPKRLGFAVGTWQIPPSVVSEASE